MAKKIKLRDKTGEQLIPITRSTTVEMNDGVNLQTAYEGINSTHYTKEEINEMGYLQNYSEYDPTVPSYVKRITQQDITNWNNKLDSFTETDPSISSYLRAITQQDINSWNNKLDSFTETDPTVPSYVKGITSTDISNWNSKTDNVGTITGITMNGASKGTSGVVDLGTVLTEHQDLSSYVKWNEKSSVSQNTDTLSMNRLNIEASSDTNIPLNGRIGFIDINRCFDGSSICDYQNGYGDDVRYSFTREVTGDVAITKDITQAINSYVISASYISSTSLNTTLASYVTSGYYDTSTHKIYLRHGTNILSEIDANDFIKDGMVDTAYVQGSNLVISFNTDAGKQPVEVPIADIFNPTNYYTKTEINNAGYLTSHQDLSSYVSKTELNNAGYLTSFTETDPIYSASPAAGITSSDISNWNSKTDNVGTITGITMNSTSKGTSGVVDLGTVVTSETQLSKGTTTGSGNAVTDISVSNHEITLTKGSTFLTAHQDLSSYVSKTELNAAGYLTSHQSIKTINGNTITGTGDVTISGLPAVNSTYNGKILQVVDGAWTLVTPLNLYSGTGTPNNTQGNNGDLYMQI